MTFLPYFARRRATIGASRPSVGDTPSLVQTSDAVSVCHSRLERSLLNGCVQSVNKDAKGPSIQKGLFTGDILLSFVFDISLLCICDMNTALGGVNNHYTGRKAKKTSKF